MENKIEKTEKSFNVFEFLNFDRIPTLIATSGAALYILGYIVVASFFASKGIYDPGLLSPKYIMAGALIAVVLVGYYFFVWRRFAALARQGIKIKQEFGSIFRLFLDVYYGVEYINGGCFLSVWLGGLLISNFFVFPAQIILLSAFLFDRFLVHLNAYESHPRLSYFSSFIFNCIAFISFCLYGLLYPPLFSLFTIFLTFTIIGSVVVSSTSWKNNEDMPYNFFYIGLTTITGIALFGSSVYEYISPKYGGGESPKVLVTLTSNAGDDIQRKLSENELYLILDTESSMTFRLGSDSQKTQYFRIDKDLVSAILFVHPTPKQATYGDDLKKIRSILEKR